MNEKDELEQFKQDFTKKYIDKDFTEPENIATQASTMEDAVSAIF